MPLDAVPAPRRVLHVISVLSVGGVETWLLALLRHMRMLQSQGIETEHFDILLTGGKRHQLDDEAESLGATLHYIPFSRRTAREFSGEFRQLLIERRYAAIHDHQDYAAGWHFIAGRGLLPPVRIAHVHNTLSRLEATRSTPIRKALFRIPRYGVKRYATHILGTSRQILTQYGFNDAEFPSKVIRPLHCGFDTAPFLQSHDEANASVCAELGWEAGSPIALFVGRLDGTDATKPGWNQKNPAFALHAARTMLVRDTDAKFVMVGGGDSIRKELDALAAGWGLADRIKLVGQRLDVARFMAASRCLVIPSIEEGLGMVAVEAQAAGMRVLASDAVPREAVVVPELVTFLSLDQGPQRWARELSALLALPRSDSRHANTLVASSDFSVASSYESLRQIYSGARVA